jgi:hypothetical protein
VPLNSSLTIGLFDFGLTRILVHTQDFVVVLALRLFKFNLRVLELLSKTGGLGIDLLYFGVFVDSFVELFLGQKNVTFLKVGFDVFFIHGDGAVKCGQRFVILTDLCKCACFIE